MGCDESEIVTSGDLLFGNENEGVERNLRSLLEKEREQEMEYRAVVADSLYDSSDNRRAIHAEKRPEGERVKAYIPSPGREKSLSRFRYDPKLKLLDEDSEHREALKKRSLIERRFGGAKKWHGLGWTRYWGKAKVAIQALMTFLVMNIKRMVKLLSMREKKVGILETG